MSLIALLYLVGCQVSVGESGTEEANETLSSESWDLVAPESWVIDQSADSFPEHLTAKHTCDPNGMVVEDGVLEIYTGDCGYLVARQPSLEKIDVGDVVEVLVYHSRLTAKEPAEAHAALSIDGELVWEETVSIPSISLVYATEVLATFEADAGADVVLHVHNHGSNVWSVGHLRVRRSVGMGTH